MRTYLKGKITLLFMTFGLLLAVPAVALAAELVTSELDTTTPNAVTVTQGGSTSFNIGLAATGSISNLITEANASIATVDTAYSLDGAGTFTKNTPSSGSKFFSSGDNSTGTNSTVTWTGAPTPYSVAATISAAATTPTGDYTLSLSPTAGDTSVSNPSVGGGKLEDKDASTITVHVVAPACTNPAVPTFSGTPNGDNGWYKTTVPTVSASSSTSGAVIKYSNAANGTYSETAPTLAEGTTTVYAKAFSSTGSCSSAAVSNTYKVDTIAPSITDEGTTQTANAAGWFKNAVLNNFSATDATSGLADASKANFSVSSGTAEGSAVNINSGPVSDLAGNTNAGIDSAAFKIDLTNPTFNCPADDGTWHATNQTFNCTASGGDSGLTPTSDANFSLSTTVAAGNETSNASTGTKTLTDGAGNTVTAPAITGVKVDRKAPALVDDGPTTDPNDAGWYKTAVTNSFTATDGGSGFAPSGEGTHSFNKLSTSEGAAVTIASSAVSDAVGNSTASINSAAFKIDLTKPAVSVTGITAATYTTTDTLPTPGCTVTDSLSGPVDASPAAVKTTDTRNSNGIGTVTYTCTGADEADNSASASKSFSVIHGGVSGILQPINPDNTSLFSRGRSVPVKFQLTGDGAGTSFLSGFNTSGWTLQRVQVNCATGFDAEDAVVEPVPSNTPTTVFRYDSSADQYIYNADFRDKAAGTCWKVKATLDDSTTVLYSAVFKLQK